MELALPGGRTPAPLRSALAREFPALTLAPEKALGPAVPALSAQRDVNHTQGVSARSARARLPAPIWTAAGTVSHAPSRVEFALPSPLLQGVTLSQAFSLNAFEVSSIFEVTQLRKVIEIQ